VTVKTENITEIYKKAESGRHVIDGQDLPKTVALRAYTGQKSRAPSSEQITNLLPMVRKIAYRAVTYLRPPLSLEDIISAGTVGLVKAARDFDSAQSAEFKTYAYIRIKGAILDELRSSSLLPVNLNKQIRNAQQLSQDFTQQTGNAPTDQQLAEKLGITVDEVYKLFENARIQYFLSIDGLGQDQPPAEDFLPAIDTPTPDTQLERAELTDKLTKAIKELDQKKRQIILLYYQQELTMKQIARILKITESRVSQLHASAIFNLSVQLRQWKDGR
jgi:RNA polymerase sigma factor for flagellar operon FliA